jgi:hypothetical protein
MALARGLIGKHAIFKKKKKKKKKNGWVFLSKAQELWD